MYHLYHDNNDGGAGAILLIGRFLLSWNMLSLNRLHTCIYCLEHILMSILSPILGMEEASN